MSELSDIFNLIKDISQEIIEVQWREQYKKRFVWQSFKQKHPLLERNKMQSCKQNLLDWKRRRWQRLKLEQNFRRTKFRRESASGNTNTIEVRVLNNNNIHQQDQQVRKPSHHHLEGGPGAIAIHTIEHTATNILDTKKKQVQVPSVNQHEVTNTLQNQITVPNTSVCNTECNDKNEEQNLS